MTNKFENKLVAVLNKSAESGKTINALAHMCIGFGAHLGTDPLQLINYQDADGNDHSLISKMPFIILQASSNKIRKLRAETITKNIQYVDFTDTMTVGNYTEQLERTAKTKEENLIYYGIILFGNWNVVSELTKKFSL